MIKSLQVILRHFAPIGQDKGSKMFFEWGSGDYPEERRPRRGKNGATVLGRVFRHLR